jgi:NAD(P)-dependent dehydrogenase (short-subunit alcohol dehydrogenase family)
MKNKKVVLITGAASGIGRKTALSFADQGHIVVAVDLHAEAGTVLVDEIISKGETATFIKTNVADWDAMQSMHQKVIDEYGRIDIAINNAGIGNIPTSMIHTSNEDWDNVMAINANGVFYGMKLQVAQMLKQGGGVIVNTASVAGLRGLPKSIAYAASKHAVIGMTKTAAMEYAKKNIRINAICPAFTITGLFHPDMMENISEGLSEKLKKTIPMQRFGEVQEIADAILWLCSDQASFINGLALPVDGGMTA